jgi:peptidoglycan/xylan/chitin deacetylase (PgdA/CDA1 family)
MITPSGTIVLIISLFASALIPAAAAESSRAAAFVLPPKKPASRSTTTDQVPVAIPPKLWDAASCGPSAPTTNMSQTLLKSFWSLATTIGLRRLGRVLQRYIPGYSDTIFFFENGENNNNNNNNNNNKTTVNGFVALTIDDGLSRGGLESSLVPQVLALLKKYNAHATFFVCTNYLVPLSSQAVDLVSEGHELGNHLKEDLSGYYCNLSRDEFQKEIRCANEALDDIDGGLVGGGVRWFRAPQGRMTRVMQEVVAAEGMQSALGDCYCDDWAFADSNSNASHVVAPLMLRQVQLGGSIAVLHMPERGFREASLQALEEFLQGTTGKNLRCITLIEMARLDSSSMDDTR